MKMRFLILSILLLMNFACKKESISDEPTNIIGEHFTYRLYDGLSENIILEIQTKLDDNYSRVLNDLGLSSMSNVIVRIWDDESNFLDDMESELGVRYTGSAGWVRGANDIRLLYRGNGTAQNALHEFCHCVSMIVNPQIPNNPRWLWEAIAIYESGEFVNPQSMSSLVNGNFPTLEELNSDFNNGNHSIYQVGYLLAEFIIENWGRDRFVALIRSNGNLEQTLEVTVIEFEEGWKNFVTTKYL